MPKNANILLKSPCVCSSALLWRVAWKVVDLSWPWQWFELELLIVLKMHVEKFLHTHTDARTITFCRHWRHICMKIHWRIVNFYLVFVMIDMIVVVLSVILHDLVVVAEVGHVVVVWVGGVVGVILVSVSTSDTISHHITGSMIMISSSVTSVSSWVSSSYQNKVADLQNIVIWQVWDVIKQLIWLHDEDILLLQNYLQYVVAKCYLCQPQWLTDQKKIPVLCLISGTMVSSGTTSPLTVTRHLAHSGLVCEGCHCFFYNSLSWCSTVWFLVVLSFCHPLLARCRGIIWNRH